MADTRTMSELLQAPTEGYGDAIVIPAILAEDFELKVGLLQLVTSSQVHGFERDDPHAHIPAGGNLLNRTPQDALMIIDNKSKELVLMNKANQQASVKSVEETYATCGGPHPYYECLATGGNTFETCAATRTYNQGGSRSLPSNTIANLRGDVKAITTRSDVAYDGPAIPPTPSSLPKEVERETEVTKDKVLTTNPGRTAHVQPLVIQIPILEPVVALKPNPKLSIPYPSRLNDQKLREKTNSQMLNGPPKKLPEKLGDLRRFLIPYDFQGLESCMALTDLGRPFLRTIRALVDVHGEELIWKDGDEKLIFHADSTSKHPHKQGDDTTPLSNSSPSLIPFETSYSLLEEFADELALLDPFPPGKEKNNFDFESDLREIEYLLNQDPSTESNIETIDLILKKFIDEPALDYLPPPRDDDDDDDDDDLFDLKSDNDEWKMLLYDHIVQSNDVFPQLLDNDSTPPEESSDSSEIASLSSSPFGIKDKIFNPSIHILDRTQIVKDESKDKDLILEDRDFLSISSDKELMFFLELIVIETLLSFSSKNKDKVFNPGILTSK
uniref:Reverse transcriptase domain-containing protein n=1 Tax=Tanacetum cinerariifolium TaxID=118510 RepID=A0A6L2KSI1_TANCI|nr:reverse transcriptase domain-containing protein [Tanacetum cinerariifolium]